MFQALAHPVRRDILALLREHARSAGELADHFPYSKPTMSGHFNVLRDADLVTVERQGTTLIYRLNVSVAEDALAGLMSLLRIDGEAAGAAPARKKGAKP